MPTGVRRCSWKCSGLSDLGPPARPALSCYEFRRCFCLPEQVRVGRVLKMIVKSQPCSNDLDSEAGPWGRRMSLHWAVTTRALHFHDDCSGITEPGRVSWALSCHPQTRPQFPPTGREQKEPPTDLSSHRTLRLLGSLPSYCFQSQSVWTICCVTHCVVSHLS